MTKPFKRIPGLIAFGVVASVCLIRWLQFDFFERLEAMTYDMRARQALKFRPVAATNLGFVFINERSVEEIASGSLGYRYGLYWPRQVYGRLVQELTAQGVKAIAFDILFGELRSDHPPVQMADGRFVESDEFFALQMRQASNTIIAITPELYPPALFRTNALALGDITAEKDRDGILRRAKAFRMYRKWHPAFQQVEDDPEFGVDLRRVRIQPGQIVLLRNNAEEIKVPLDKDGNFDLADFGGERIPPGMARKAKPFKEERVWHMGIVLAAQQLGLDLARAEVDLDHGKIILRGPEDTKRVIPVDSEGYFYIDWSLTTTDPQLTQEAIHSLLWQNRKRLEGKTNELQTRWQNKLAVVGSGAVLGNNVTDRGATPLSNDTLLVSKHWNVANSIITGRFVQRGSLGLEIALIVVMGIVAALLTWELRALLAFGLVILLALLYIAVGIVVYVQTRYWLPLVLPVTGALLATHLCLVTWRVVFEQAQRRRLKSIFSKVVSPKIVHELVESENLPSLGGARREVTVLFADVRGFTELTDTNQERAAEFVRQHHLSGAAAEACFDEQARETLSTVNLYLGLVADILIKRDGTLDKFIGDCVMAFWGAPTSSAKHALACVRAAIDAQRAIYELNQQRSLENQRRELENLARVSAGLKPKPILPILLLGSGINTGLVTVGLMGSELEQQNYTVFGREVNLASRLEGASGRGRIFIGETTYQHLLRDDPALAATCSEFSTRDLKGFRSAVKAYEVPWRPAGSLPLEEEAASSSSDGTSFTGLIQRQG